MTILNFKEAEERNHRRLGKQLKLFMFSEEAPGMPFYLSNGQFIRNQMESFLREFELKHDYDEVRTPLMMNKRLWEESDIGTIIMRTCISLRWMKMITR